MFGFPLDVIRRAVDAYRKAPAELGEFSLPNEYRNLVVQDELEHTPDGSEEPLQPKGPTMTGRPTNATKTASVPAATVDDMVRWKSIVEAKGFEVLSYQYMADGVIVSATCEKNERQQIITPEILGMMQD